VKLMQNVVALFGAFAVVTALMPLVRMLALNHCLVDKPNPRKVHQVPVPVTGGAMWLGLIAVMWVLPVERQLALGLTLGGTAAFAVGFLDDWVKSRGGDFPAWPKLLGQILAAGLLFASGVKVYFLTNPFSGGLVMLSPALSFLVTVIWVVAVTNLINFMDGLDGLACGIVTIASVTMAVISFFMGQPTTLLMFLVLAGVSAAFFRFNFNPARAFMGDAGAYFLGFTLSAISIEGAFKSATLVGLLVPFLVLGLPIADTLYNIMRRLRSGQPVYVADKGHTHHRLLQAGLSHRQTVLVMYLISLCFSLTALVVLFASRW